jgi:hypothetical protein
LLATTPARSEVTLGNVIRFPVKLPPGMVSPVVPPGHCAPDGFVEWMRKRGIPVTRENYIRLAVDEGTVPSSYEQELPEELR